MNQRIKAVINEVARRLKNTGVDQPKLSAEIIVAAALKCQRLELYLRPDEKIPARSLKTIRQGLRRLAAGEPIQYVLGTAGFMGHTFKCDRRALIPRPETEQLVELVLDQEPLWRLKSPSIIDIGTGTGCIVISLALNKQKGRFWAIDISSGAIELAKENARRHNVKYRNLETLNVQRPTSSFERSELNVVRLGGSAVRKSLTLSVESCRLWPLNLITFITADFNNNSLPLPSKMDAVVANPPYVRASDYRRLPRHIRLWEPKPALDGGKDGLRTIRPLIKKAFQILKPDRWLFMEIGAGQWPAVKCLILSSGFRQCSVKRDHAGHARMVIAVK